MATETLAHPNDLAFATFSSRILDHQPKLKWAIAVTAVTALINPIAGAIISVEALRQGYLLLQARNGHAHLKRQQE